MQLAAGFFGPDVQALRQQHRPGIQAGLHLHQADAGLLVAGFDGALDRRRAAPAGQQRGMHVPAAVLRDVEHRLRQDQAVGHHDHHVGLHLAQCVLGGLLLQRQRLQYGNAALDRLQLDRGRRQPAPSAGGPVGLGVDGHHFMVGMRGAQAGHGERRRAGEDDSHGGREWKMGNGGWKAAAVAATGPPARQRTVMPGSPFPPRRLTPRACAAWPASCAPSRASAARGSRRTACRPGDPSRAGCRRPAGRRPATPAAGPGGRGSAR